MRIWKFLGVFALIMVPVLSRGEVVYLKDGSTIQGTVIRLVNDTLYFEADFGSEVRIPKAKVLRIEFLETRGLLQGSSMGTSHSVARESSIAGTLRVHFEPSRFTSRISVHRGKNRDALERANSIEKAFYVSGDKVFSVVDSLTDKVIREGPETILRNDMTPETFSVVVTPGQYNCRLYIGNSRAGDYEDMFIGNPLDNRLVAERVIIQPGQTTELRVGVKRKLKIGSSYLFLYD
ncbi:MAG: hypothetical protein OEN01_12805 [Candidatus Krumholzibacteria bacterium]|nr:hypothetical protein [Candidatus Krumholzibacteria bacterium]